MKINLKVHAEFDIDGSIRPTSIVCAICGLRRTVLRSKTDAMRSERTDLI